MSTAVFLPWRGEFGQMIMSFVRWVYAQRHDFSTHIVCCQEDHKILFPSASAFFTDWAMPPDEVRCTAYLSSEENKLYLKNLELRLRTIYPKAQYFFPLNGVKPQRYSPPVERIPINSQLEQQFDIFPEILVAPRYRKYGQHRNYPHWKTIFEFLRESQKSYGLIGVRETSIDDEFLDEKYKAWNYEKNLDVTVCWMKKAKLVLCTDSGLAHLAVLVGAPLYVIYEKPGVEAGKEEWSWCYPRMKKHAFNTCEPILYGWSNVQNVLSALEKI